MVIIQQNCLQNVICIYKNQMKNYLGHILPGVHNVCTLHIHSTQHDHIATYFLHLKHSQ